MPLVADNHDLES